ncbi:MAG TPA: antibiotic biosynthesis monooxygenase [Candidatus Acidoferrum sp.]|nr:antibiotic biosynthesis monooxygenase [Candidatus Methylomirabilis sp.]HWU39025.1 antibiotic biosynthesis monooxygenase [Candidatus Acidoferrum sp.]
MYAVMGRVQIKPGHEEEARQMVAQHGADLLQGMPGSRGGYWARTIEGTAVIQHSFWLFESEEGARVAETTFKTLRDMPEAPATFLSVDVCEVIGQAP